MITKAVASAAIFLGLSMAGAVPAGAQPGQSDPNNPNPFAGLTCNCQQHAPKGAPNFGEVNRGLQAALAAG
jgi:hypothetical protein